MFQFKVLYYLGLNEFRHSDIEVKGFSNLTKFCIIHFRFKFKFYKKKCNGLSMENLLSPILFDNYMYYFQANVLKLLKCKCWMRYFIEKFVLVHTPFDIWNIMQTVKSINTHIPFIFCKQKILVLNYKKIYIFFLLIQIFYLKK